ncbi:MAG: N-acetylmuramoyl-L-alanine amidase [Bryobacteraceae bacterium]|nr:N-acetylmuramoyl-L-alanine amidase [Bryobacteraceae bacterium]MDW8376814.1 N-acetylmuramoyl-L-alanine amidase [Bryobacterales bacterium]
MGGNDCQWKPAVAPGWLAALAGALFIGFSAEANSLSITAVRFWSLDDHTRIAIETSAAFTYRQDRLGDPPRIFFDLNALRPQFVKKGVHTIPVGDPRVKQLRIAETQPGVTRVVIDLEEGDFEYTASQTARPDQLLIEVRAKSLPLHPAPSVTPTGSKQLESQPAAPRVVARPPETTAGQPIGPPVEKPERVVRTFVMPKTSKVGGPPFARALPEAPRIVTAYRPRYAPYWVTPDLSRFRPPAVPPRNESLTRASIQPKDEAAVASETGPETELVSQDSATAPPPSSPVIAAKPATRNSNGDRSLTRALGLKVRRVVIDPGHGGSDYGSTGVSGLLEKDLVLDVAKRLGALIEERLGSEVIYTRTADVFVPLEERTRIANSKKADLFISVHANSSPVSSVTGVETYYLSLTTLKSSLDLAARENATSERSIHELRDLIQKIALKEKVDESREFALRVQSALSQLSIQHGAKGSSRRDRGVKKAPFIVLIGAAMPSILAEVGFLSNPKEEQNLRKGEYRQKLAEALFKGISSYAQSLSHFQVAQAKSPRSE